jgi:glyoxalase family protein
MKLEGVHHITAITGDAPANVEFYTGTLGLRMVKRTVNRTTPPSITCSMATRTGLRGWTSPSSSTRAPLRGVPAPA